MELNRLSNEITSNQIETIRLIFFIRFSGRADHYISIGEKLWIEARLEQLNFPVFANLNPGQNLGSDFCKLLPNAKDEKIKLCRSKPGFVIKPPLLKGGTG